MRLQRILWSADDFKTNYKKKEILKLTGEITKEVIRYLLLLPFIPLALGIVLFFSWAMSKASKIPEDLDEQCSNSGNCNKIDNQ